MLQVPKVHRYMTGWRIDVSYDGEGFTTIDSREENFCSKNYTNGANNDCGELTTRSFNVPITTAKVIKLVQTREDSCGTYCIHMSGFDVYGDSPNIICKNTHRMQRSSPFKYPCILLIIYNS